MELNLSVGSNASADGVETPPFRRSPHHLLEPEQQDALQRKWAKQKEYVFLFNTLGFSLSLSLSLSLSVCVSVLCCAAPLCCVVLAVLFCTVVAADQGAY